MSDQNATVFHSESIEATAPAPQIQPDAVDQLLALIMRQEETIKGLKEEVDALNSEVGAIMELLEQKEKESAVLPTTQATLLVGNPYLSSPGKTSLPTWEGHSCTSLIRAMCILGAKPAPIGKVLVQLGIHAAPNTITTQSHHARHGQKGAALTPDQRATLVQMLNTAMGVAPIQA